jgi:hypothetical protein
MRKLFVLGAALAVLQVPAAAQNPQVRSGFTVSFGLGAGPATFDCDGCGSDSETGTVAYLRLGGAVRPNLIIAGEVGGWLKEEDGVTFSAGNVTATLQWYPSTTGGFFLKGGAGYGSVELEFDTGLGTFSASRSGLGLQAGTGYDFRVSRNFSLTPFASWYWTSVDEDDTDITVNAFHIGLGFTWH